MKLLLILMSIGPYSKAIIALVIMIPFIMMFKVFQKSFGVNPEAIMFWGFMGVFLCFLFAALFGFVDKKNLFVSPGMALLLLMFGVIGAIPYVIIADAIRGEGVNPAIIFIIVDVANPIAYVLAPIVAILLPRYIEQISFGWVKLAAIVGIVICIVIIKVDEHYKQKEKESTQVNSTLHASQLNDNSTADT